jgi:hypothetical protein
VNRPQIQKHNWDRLLGGGTEDVVDITAPPQSKTFTKSASIFTQVNVNNYGLLLPAPGTYDGSQVRYRNQRDNGVAIANNEFTLAKAGVCILPASGAWWVNVNTNIAAGSYSAVLYDFPSLEALVAAVQTIQNADAGTLTPSAPATATIGAASAQIVAANTSRKLVSITNTGTTDGTTATASKLYLGFGATAVIGSGIMLVPGQTLIFSVSDGIVLGVINGISTSGNIAVGVQEMV